MNPGYFITGTDTGAGKTFVTCALLHAFAARGRRVLAMKPVAAGAERVGDRLVNADVSALSRAANVAAPLEAINPYVFEPPVAPHLAAAAAGVSIDPARIHAAWRQLTALAPTVLVEGAGGFLVPLDEACDLGDLARELDLPVILVVGMKLGCINHALLSAEAIRARGLKLAGWVANQPRPAMRLFDANVAALQARLAAPLLGVLRYRRRADAAAAAGLLEVGGL